MVVCSFVLADRLVTIVIACLCLCGWQELAEVEAESKKTQTLKQSVVVMGNARRELNKATVSIEEVNFWREALLCVRGVAFEPFWW